MPDLYFWIIAVLAVFIVALSKSGLVGSLGLVAVPMLSLVMPARDAAGMMLPLLLVMDAIAVWTYRKDCDWRILKIMLPGAMLGTLIGFEGPPGKVFEITIQLGAILAVIVLFRRTLLDLALNAWRPGPQRFYAINILLAFLPAAVIGATLHGTITRLLFNP